MWHAHGSGGGREPLAYAGKIPAREQLGPHLVDGRRTLARLLSGQRRTLRGVFLPEKRKVDSSILSLTTAFLLQMSA